MKKFTNMLGGNDAKKLVAEIKKGGKTTPRYAIESYITKEAKQILIKETIQDLPEADYRKEKFTPEEISNSIKKYDAISSEIQSKTSKQDILDTKLWIDVHCDNAKMIEISIRDGANVNTIDTEGYTLLSKAMSTNKNKAVLALLSHDAAIDTTKAFQVDYLSSSNLSIFEHGNSYQKFKAWINIFNTFSKVSDNPQHTQSSQKIIKNLAVAWNNIDLAELKTTFVAKKIGDISKPTVDLYNAMQFCCDNKDKYEESNTELYGLLQKLIPELEKSVNELNNYKANLMFKHIKSEVQNSPFKTAMNKCIAECRSLEDPNFLEKFLIDYLFQSDELTDEIPIIYEETKVEHLGDAEGRDGCLELR